MSPTDTVCTRSATTAPTAKAPMPIGTSSDRDHEAEERVGEEADREPVEQPRRLGRPELGLRECGDDRRDDRERGEKAGDMRPDRARDAGDHDDRDDGGARAEQEVVRRMRRGGVRPALGSREEQHAGRAGTAGEDDREARPRVDGLHRREHDEEDAPAGGDRDRPPAAAADGDVRNHERDQRDDPEHRPDGGIGREPPALVEREHEEDRPGDHGQPADDAAGARAVAAGDERDRDDERRREHEPERERRHGATLVERCREGIAEQEVRLLRQRKSPAERGFSSGARRARTADLLGAIQALSQLSYSPEVRRKCSAGRLQARNRRFYRTLTYDLRRQEFTLPTPTT